MNPDHIDANTVIQVLREQLSEANWKVAILTAQLAEANRPEPEPDPA